MKIIKENNNNNKNEVVVPKQTMLLTEITIDELKEIISKEVNVLYNSFAIQITEIFQLLNEKIDSIITNNTSDQQVFFKGSKKEKAPKELNTTQAVDYLENKHGIIITERNLRSMVDAKFLIATEGTGPGGGGRKPFRYKKYDLDDYAKKHKNLTKGE